MPSFAALPGSEGFLFLLFESELEDHEQKTDHETFVIPDLPAIGGRDRESRIDLELDSRFRGNDRKFYRREQK